MRLIDIEPFETEKDVGICQIQRWHCGDGYQSVETTPTKDIPTIDALPVVHAKWERCFEDWRQQIEGDKCSACGFEHYGASIRLYHYCPNCGARMDGE